MPDAIRAEIARCLALGWEWRILTHVVNRSFGTAYTARQLRELYGEEARGEEAR